MEILRDWFNKHKVNPGKVELPYIGYTTQGPLRTTDFNAEKFPNPLIKPSPLSTQQRAPLAEDKLLYKRGC